MQALTLLPFLEMYVRFFSNLIHELPRYDLPILSLHFKGIFVIVKS